MRNQKLNLNFAAGQAVLTTVIFLLFVSVAILFSFSTIALSETRAARGEENSVKAYMLAEAGVEDVAYRIIKGKQYASPESLTLDGVTAVTTITTVGSTREVVSQGNVSSRLRSVKTVLTTTAGVSFIYGAQVGDGGIFMENTSKIIGSVYSNGDITAQNEPKITGDAFAAAGSTIKDMDQIGGNARAHRIQGNTIVGHATSSTVIAGGSVGKDGWADTFSGGTISGDAYYKTSVSATTTVNGAKKLFPAGIESPPANLAKLPMPISDAQLDDWEREASLLGTTTPSSCPYKPDDDENPTIQGVVTCDVTIEGTNIITLTGVLRVKGNFIMQNSAQLKLAPSFCSGSPPLSGIVIADKDIDRSNSSKVSIDNSAQILGCGAGSYIMAVSRNNSAESGGSETAIDIKNSSATAIFYAPHGELLFQNNGQMKEATAWKLHTKNFVEVIYESGLANVQFSSGPTGGWKIESWQETQ
ncbi:MAG: hypothetical protein WAP51_01770 [Candidatus Sungiibacteriota bacterium]